MFHMVQTPTSRSSPGHRQLRKSDQTPQKTGRPPNLFGPGAFPPPLPPEKRRAAPHVFLGAAAALESRGSPQSRSASVVAGIRGQGLAQTPLGKNGDRHPLVFSRLVDLGEPLPRNWHPLFFWLT